MKAIKFIATGLYFTLAVGCSALQSPPVRAVYDLGPPVLPSGAASANARSAPPSHAPAPALTPVLALAPVESSAALEGTSLLYRLAYANAQQLQPYALARWSMAPAQLLRQRLSDALAQRGPVLQPGEGHAALLLRIELDEFSQRFDSPTRSQGQVRLRATLLRQGQLLAQRSFAVQQPAPSPDAAGGAQALAAATDAAVAELVAWITPTLQGAP